jgi:cytochrome c
MTRTLLLLTALCSAPLCLAQDSAEAGATLAQARHCHACHHPTEALLGPAYQAIAARHAAKKEVMVEVLARKIILGGGGNWGLVPMVPNEHVSAGDAQTLARWILEQASE